MTESRWRALQRRLERVPSTGDYLEEIDGLRFVAIVPVVVLHLAGQAIHTRRHIHGDWEALGEHDPIVAVIASFTLGVPLFFVISGFILARPMASHALGHTTERPSLARYCLRRITRIEPPYLLALTVHFLVLPWVPLRSYLAGLVYMHGFVLHRMNVANVAFWSLEVEVLFYLSAPLLARAFRLRAAWLRRTLAVGAIIGCGLFEQRWISAHAPYLTYTFAGCVQFFLAGMLLADLYVSGLVRRRRALRWDFVSGLALALMFHLQVGRLRTYNSLLPLCIALLIFSVFQSRILNRLLRLAPIRITGSMCYSIYLWHNLFILGLMATPMWRIVERPATHGGASVVASVAFLPVIFLGAVALFFATERPFMNGPGSRALDALIRRAVARIGGSKSAR